MGSIGEAERFDLFVQRAGELFDTRMVGDGDLHASMSMSVDLGGPLSVDVHEPDEEHLRSFLLTFRQFVSEREPIFVRRVAGLLWERLSGDGYRGTLLHARQEYSRAVRTGAFQLVLDGDHVTPEQVTDWWVNGYYFHNDEQKRAVPERLVGLRATFGRQAFLGLLVDTTNYIGSLAGVILVTQRSGAL